MNETTHCVRPDDCMGAPSKDCPHCKPGCCQHFADCAVHNGPAYMPGPCDCGRHDDACPVGMFEAGRIEAAMGDCNCKCPRAELPNLGPKPFPPPYFSCGKCGWPHHGIVAHTCAPIMVDAVSKEKPSE